MEMGRVLDVARAFKQGRGCPFIDKTVVLFFMDPSTRTRVSFQAAALRLGMRVLPLDQMSSLQLSKGESLWDTARMLRSVADVAVFRGEGLIEFTDGFGGPVINAGAEGLHPTQAMADYLTLEEECLLEPACLTMVGAPRHRRAQTSFLLLVKEGKIKPKKVVIISEHEEPVLGDGFNLEYEVRSELDLRDAHLIYMSNMSMPGQGRPWAPNPFRLTATQLYGKMKVMHPLARHEELDTAIDGTRHNLYFKQMDNLLPVRIGVLACAV